MLQHEDALNRNGLLVCSNDIQKCRIWVLLCQFISWIELTINETHAIDYLIIDLFPAPIHNLGAVWQLWCSSIYPIVTGFLCIELLEPLFEEVETRYDAISMSHQAQIILHLTSMAVNELHDCYASVIYCSGLHYQLE